jgi:hypothetical protein
MRAIVSKLSLCPCGFPVLRDEVGIGAEYEVDTSHPEDDFTLICGGCGKHNPVRGLFFKQKGDSGGGYLPKEIFNLCN